MDKTCYQCKYFSELKEHRGRSDGSVIYGYCFSAGDKNYSVHMGKGIAVFLPESGVCKSFVRKRGGGKDD